VGGGRSGCGGAAGLARLASECANSDLGHAFRGLPLEITAVVASFLSSAYSICRIACSTVRTLGPAHCASA